MQKIRNSFWLGPAITGLLAFLNLGQINFWACWICYIPLFISISNAQPKAAFKRGMLYGFVLAALAFYWMIPGAERFTGLSIFYGIGAFLISAAFLAAYQGSLLYCFTVLKKDEAQPYAVIVNSVLMASVFTVGEALMSVVGQGFPWFNLYSGSGLSDNLYTIQPAAIFGVHILSFIVVLINYLAAYYINRKHLFKLYVPFAVAILFVITGFLLFQNFNNQRSNSKPFKLAILAENIPAEVKWDDNTGNMMVQRLLELNKSAVVQKPDMILWSESAIPWTYKKDDDLVNAILAITGPANITHIMGINTAYKDNEVFNSAYCILPNGQATGRYDKQYLLTFIEKPVSGLIMPFFSSKGFIARNDKEHAAPLTTPYGKAGMLICNEASVAVAASAMVKNGAQYLFNISNDGWFNNTYIVRLHYYYARLRAVESRKDLAVDCNNGYSGLIKASGEIEEQQRSEDPFVTMVTIQPNNYISLASSSPNLFLFACTLFIAGAVNLLGKARRKRIINSSSTKP